MIGRLNHVAIAVPDLAAAADRYRDVLGAAVSAPLDQPEHGVTVIFVTLPNTKIELLGMLGQDSPIARFLARNQDGGIHHLCYEVPDIERARIALEAAGARALGPAKTGAHGRPVLFLHPKDFSGTLIELEESPPDEPSIRLGRPDDLEVVQRIVALAYAPYVARIGRAPAPMLADYAPAIAAGHLQVLELAGEVKGLIVLRPDAGGMLLENLALLPEAQGRGLGTRLIRLAEAATIKAGLPLLKLYTNEAMTENLRLYARLGFRETHRAEQDGLRRVFMEKPLKA